MILIENIATIVHVLLGIAAILAGCIALYAKKGQVTHIKFGHTFTGTMVFSSAIGGVLGLLKFSAFFITTLAGILSITLVLSGVLAVQRGKANTPRQERRIATLNGLNFLVIFSSGIFATQSLNGILFGFHAEDYFFLSAMAAIALCGDLRYFSSKTLTHANRLIRHLWRMCLGLFIAVGSAFTGPGMNAFPETIQNSGLLPLPEFIILIVMIFWLVRIRYFGNAKAVYKHTRAKY